MENDFTRTYAFNELLLLLLLFDISAKGCIIVYNYFFKNNTDEGRLGSWFPFEINQKRLGKNFKRSRVTAQFTRMERGQLFNYPGRTLSSKEYRVSFRRANGTHHNEPCRLP